jgi:xylulose-5-phosphate/fructose-6-phosphate phosphoketolase
MVVRNDLDRFHLVADVVERVERVAAIQPYIKQRVRDKLVEHREYIAQRGVDLPEVANWNWPY